LSSPGRERLVRALRARVEMFIEKLRWRRYMGYFAQAARRLLGPEVRVLVFGSAARGELTADSDIDILLVVPRVPESASERAALVAQMLAEAEKRGMPWWYPVEVHWATPEELERWYRRHLDAVVEL